MHSSLKGVHLPLVTDAQVTIEFDLEFLYEREFDVETGVFKRSIPRCQLFIDRQSVP